MTSDELCKWCKGTGKIPEYYIDIMGYEHFYRRCVDCNGTGKVKEKEATL